jgi:hypothetical protein
MALVGAIGLVRLAYHVTAPKRELNEGIAVRQEVVSLWLHPALHELALSPSESAAFRTRQEYRRYARERGLENAWYIITVRSIPISGATVISSTIRRPYEMVDPFYSEFPDALATAAGSPPSHPFTDFATARVAIIPSGFLDADPHAVLDELRMLEHLTRSENAAVGPGS